MWPAFSCLRTTFSCSRIIIRCSRDFNLLFSSYLNAMHRQGYSITFLYGAKDWPAKDDREFVAFVKPRLKFDLKIFEAKNIDQWLSCIENAELLVSGRFHHTIAAGCLGTRFIALNSNTPKMDGKRSGVLVRSSDNIGEF